MKKNGVWSFLVSFLLSLSLFLTSCAKLGTQSSATKGLSPSSSSSSSGQGIVIPGSSIPSTNPFASAGGDTPMLAIPLQNGQSFLVPPLPSVSPSYSGQIAVGSLRPNNPSDSSSSSAVQQGGSGGGISTGYVREVNQTINALGGSPNTIMAITGNGSASTNAIGGTISIVLDVQNPFRGSHANATVIGHGNFPNTVGTVKNSGNSASLAMPASAQGQYAQVVNLGKIAIDTSTVGKQLITATGYDSLGNPVSTSATVNVVQDYNCLICGYNNFGFVACGSASGADEGADLVSAFDKAYAALLCGDLTPWGWVMCGETFAGCTAM